MGYQIFISYRRNGGELLGKILYDRLTQRGYQVFMDVENMRSGLFNEQLYQVIEECEDFLLLLSPGAMDRCIHPEDWVRREISHAISKKKNIVPVVMRDFVWPEELPEELQILKYYEALSSNTEYWDAMFDRLCRTLLHSIPDTPATEVLYPVTCEDAFRTPVLKLFQYLESSVPWDDPKARKTVFQLLRVYFFCDDPEVKNAVSETDLRYRGILDSVAEWHQALKDKHRREIQDFFRRIDDLQFEFEAGYPRRPSGQCYITRNGVSYETEDVFLMPDGQKYILAYTYGENSLPEIHLFAVDPDGCTLHKISENSQIFVKAVVYYAMSLRLICPFISAVEKKIHTVSSIKDTLEGAENKNMHALQLFRYYEGPVIRAEYRKKGVLGTRTSTFTISLESTYEYDAARSRDTSYFGLSSMQAADIMEVDQAGRSKRNADSRAYLALLLPWDKKREKLQNQPVLYQIVCRKEEETYFVADMCEKTPAEISRSFSSAAKKFSLKLTVMKYFQLLET